MLVKKKKIGHDLYLKSYRNNNTYRVAFFVDNGRLNTILDSYPGALADL